MKALHINQFHMDRGAAIAASLKPKILIVDEVLAFEDAQS